MLVLNPKNVRLDSETLEDVTSVSIDRRAERTAVEWSDFGEHAVFADVPEQRVTIRIVQDVARGDVGGLVPGDERALSFGTAPTGGHAGRRLVSATVVVTGVSHELSRKRGAVRMIDCIAVSADGPTDPVLIEDSEGGEA